MESDTAHDEIVRNRQAGSGVKGIAAPRSRGFEGAPSPPAPFPRGVGAALLDEHHWLQGTYVFEIAMSST